MKRLVISALSALTLTTLVAPAMAGEIAFKKSLNRSEVARTSVSQITPFNLVTGSYQGRFTNHGIPAGGSFLSQVKSNRIDAQDLVKAAIASNRLSVETLQDQSYLGYVDSLLENLEKN